MFSKNIVDNISDMLDSNHPKVQASFRTEMSTMDYIQTVYQVTGNSNDYRKQICLAFIDYDKAVKSVEIVAVLNGIREEGVGKTYCRILKNLHKEGTAAMKLYEDTEKVETRKRNQKG